MKYKVESPTVRLIGQYDSIRDAWIASRPHLSQSDEELHVLNKLDLPVQGFSQIALHIRGSVAFRELLYMIRPSVCWAQSMRTIDLQESNLVTSIEVPDPSKLTKCYDRFLDAKKSGIQQDLCKNLLPTGMMTEYCISLDLRTLANVYKGIKKLSPILYKYYMEPIKDLIQFHLDYNLDEFPGKDFIVEDLFISDTDRKALESGVTKLGRMNLVGGKMQLVLSAQAIRKQYDKVYSDIVPAILSGDIYDKDQSEEYLTVLYLTDSSYKFMQSTRTCFFAKYDHDSTDSWSSVIGNNVKNLSTEEFGEQLPCGGDCYKCPFRAEQLARVIAGNTVDYQSLGEVNPPCPLLVGNKNTQYLREYLFQSDSIIHKKWTEYLNSLPDLALTKDGVDYMYNVTNYGFASKENNEITKKTESLKILTNVSN